MRPPYRGPDRPRRVIRPALTESRKAVAYVAAVADFEDVDHDYSAADEDAVGDVAARCPGCKVALTAGTYAIGADGITSYNCTNCEMVDNFLAVLIRDAKEKYDAQS